MKTKYFNLFAVLVLVLLFFSCGELCIGGTKCYMEPGEEIVNLNKEASLRCSEMFTGHLTENSKLTILSSVDISFNQERIIAGYKKVIASVEKLLGKDIPTRQFKLVLISFKKIPHNYKYIDSSNIEEKTTVVLLDENSKMAATDEILCSVSSLAHELVHRIGHFPSVKRNFSLAGGWFEEGVACYSEYLAGIGCKGGHADERESVTAFLDEKTRNYIFKSFAPGITVMKMNKEERRKYKILSKEKIESIWQKVDKGYDASLGAFIFLERKIGREKLWEIIRALDEKHRYQDENFYQDLASKVGFDIRKVTQQEIEEVFADNK